MKWHFWKGLILNRPFSAVLLTPWLFLFILLSVSPTVVALSPEKVGQLRLKAIDLFYHGFDNYIAHAFPEDELRPLSCQPLTRDWANPGHNELNDVLGNYSLTLVDSLSTLAILASSPPPDRDPWLDFQWGVTQLVDLYGDGSDTPARTGKRATGFDLDSKVQVFETVIRGVGGLVSAHLFAIGELPVKGYSPTWTTDADGRKSIQWPDGFLYNGQLLRLASDLAERLLPAFSTDTGLPYPRVNLRTGIPFYTKRQTNGRLTLGEHLQEAPEITETCSAGAGSLILEFSTLSRLTGDPRFELAAKTAFWAIWTRRSSLNLIGSGIDAETGIWVDSYTGIGAGIDSFFEYAFKSSVLLSGAEPMGSTPIDRIPPSSYLQVFDESLEAINQHIYRRHHHRHPHFIQGDIITGSIRAVWIDSLSAYHPGLLALAGEIEQATESHMLFAALWTRYSAIPERWSTSSIGPESGLHWWGGRPEFIESNWYLYQATKDPWYLHIGEMVLSDIKRRCWAKCGLAGLQNVVTGHRMDRMETFFLSETAKYLFLLFTPDHPLHSIDRAFVFSTEGHPLVLPRVTRKAKNSPRTYQNADAPKHGLRTCPAPPPPSPFFSAVMSRPDFFHPSELVGLGLTSPLRPKTPHSLRLSASNATSPNNFSVYPWTLPAHYIPSSGVSSPFPYGNTVSLSFPRISNSNSDIRISKRVNGGILISPSGGFQMTMVYEEEEQGLVLKIDSISTMMMNTGESAFFPHRMVNRLDLSDEAFKGVRDPQRLDIVLDISSADPWIKGQSDGNSSITNYGDINMSHLGYSLDSDHPGSSRSHVVPAEDVVPKEDDSMFASILEKLRAFMPATSPSAEELHPTRLYRVSVPAYFLNSNGRSSSKIPNTEFNGSSHVFPGSLYESSSRYNNSNLGRPPPPEGRDERDNLDELSNEEVSMLPYFSNLPLQNICFASSSHSVRVDNRDQGASSALFSCEDGISAEMAASCHVIVIKVNNSDNNDSTLLSSSPHLTSEMCSPEKVMSLIPSVPRTAQSIRLVVMVAVPSSDLSSATPLSSDSIPRPRPRLQSESTSPSNLRNRTDDETQRPSPLAVLLVDKNPDRLWNLLKAAHGLGVRRRWVYWSGGVPITNLVVV